MQKFDYTISDPDGIHARPAGMLVKKMQEFESEITISKGDKTANGKKLFQVMKLGVKCRDAITIAADGTDEAHALAKAKAILEANL